MFLGNNLGNDLTLIPEGEWKEAYEKFLPIGRVLGIDVFIYPNPDDDGELLLGQAGGVCSGQLLLREFPSLETVLGWYENTIRSEAQALFTQAEWVSNVAKWGSVTPPLKMEMPQWQQSAE